MATQIAQQIHAGAVDEIKTGGCRVVTGGGHAIAVIYHDGQVVLQVHADDDRAGDPVGRIDAVEVGERALHLLTAVRVYSEIVGDLLVGIGVGRLDGVRVAAPVGSADRRRFDLGT